MTNELVNDTSGLHHEDEFPEPGTPLDQRLEAISDAVGDADLAEIKLKRAVRAAREEGASWSHIGLAAGMSKQAAHKRWSGDDEPERCDAIDRHGRPCLRNAGHHPQPHRGTGGSW